MCVCTLKINPSCGLVAFWMKRMLRGGLKIRSTSFRCNDSIARPCGEIHQAALTRDPSQRIFCHSVDFTREIIELQRFHAQRNCERQTIANDLTFSLRVHRLPRPPVPVLVGWLVGWLECWLAGWRTDCHAGWLAGWLVSWLAASLAGQWIVRTAGWLVGWLASWLVCLWVGWRAGRFTG